MCAALNDMHDPILDGPARGAKPVKPTIAVMVFLALGLVGLLMSCLPVRSDLESSRNAVTMPPALMASWIAAGLGSYGLFRYRSSRMTVLALSSMVVGFLVGVRFWLLVMPK